MNINDIEEIAGQTIDAHRFRRLAGALLVATLAAMVAVTLALLRWSANPAKRFVQTAVSLTAISLLPPVLVDAHAATTAALIGLHLVAATVMIPTLARSLRTRTD